MINDQNHYSLLLKDKNKIQKNEIQYYKYFSWKELILLMLTPLKVSQVLNNMHFQMWA